MTSDPETKIGFLSGRISTEEIVELKCADHSAVADIELNCGGYGLCRPGQKAKELSERDL